jgi:hypothetical protein
MKRGGWVMKWGNEVTAALPEGARGHCDKIAGEELK